MPTSFIYHWFVDKFFFTKKLVWVFAIKILGVNKALSIYKYQRKSSKLMTGNYYYKVLSSFSFIPKYLQTLNEHRVICWISGTSRLL